MAYNVDSWLVNLLLKTKFRYKLMYGGRGGGKSVAIADALIILATQKKLNILCTRQYQGSMKDSVHSLISRRISEMGLSSLFLVQNDSIYCQNGSYFSFKGVERSVDSIKSIDNIDYCWVEEAQTLTAKGLKILTPSIRGNTAEIWFSMNPTTAEDALWQFCFNTNSERITVPSPMASLVEVNKDERSLLIKVNYDSNPYFPKILDDDRLRCLRNNPDDYANIWLGEPATNSNANIFKDHWRVEDFTPTADWGFPLYGMDFGYSNDPTTLVKCYLYNDTIYIEKSAGKVNLDINDIASYFFNEFGEDLSRTSISADCSQPMTIEYLRTHGLSGIHACQKWSGSIIDGISWLKSFGKMVVHSRATGVIDNLRLYSNKVDLRNDKVLNEPKDANNDYIDALRYAFDRIIKTNGSYWHLFDKIGDDF